MTSTITKTIGATERTLRALLDRELATVPLTFEAWTLLVFLNQGTTRATLVEKLLAGGIVADPEAAKAALEPLVTRGWVHEDGGLCRLTETGQLEFGTVALGVSSVVAAVLEGIDEGALNQAEAVLGTILARARARITG